ncbi:DUF1559 domain-containing protein [Anatilimnocola floriformis]|uniref:DUF1559 domain-containing protein n=1 Tax=Anatilimnocola floriformis TaxID=2948575 RepID=UPI0020C5451E|nr:DUF1559 domain-containing protein [Anatilimnocola floriformis]
MMGFGAAELTIMLMFLGGFGLPLGVPPAPENPAMHYVAPEKCVLYSSWAGMATPDASSANQTEQLFAEAEIQEFGKSLEKTIGLAVRHFAQQNGDPKADLMAKVIPNWTKTVITRPAAVFATKIEMAGGKLAFEGGLLLDAGATEAPLLADGLIQMMKSPDHPPQMVKIGAVQVAQFAPLKGSPVEAEISIGAAGPYVLIGFGKGSVAGMMDRVRAKQVPAWLAAIGTRLPVERRASISYLNTKAISQAFLPLAGPDGEKVAKALGLEQIGELVSVTGLDKDGMVSRSLLKIDGNTTGLLALIDTAGIKAEQVAFLPKDATFATAFTLNTQQVYSFAAHLVSQLDPNGGEEFEEMAKGFRQNFGMRLQEDVLASLGETWTLSMSPTDGLLGVIATVEVKDPIKLNQFVERVTGMFSDGPPGAAPRIDTAQFQGNAIRSVAVPGMPFRPAWSISGNRLIIALAPQSIKAQLGAKATETGLFNTPAYAAAFQGDSRVIALSHQDSAKIFETTYGYLNMFLPMMLDARSPFDEGPPTPQFFDFATLPSSRSIHRHLRPSTSITKRATDGIETESRQTFPTLNVGTSGPIAVALLLPAVQASRAAAQRMQSSNNLKQQMLGLLNYHDTFLHMPPAYSVSKDKDKKPLLSWRVHILPFVEQLPLYEQFKLDEPWDSPHNIKLLDKMPQVYRSPGSSAAPGKTTYLAVGGPKGMLGKPDAMGRGITLAAVTDGTSNTVAIVEAGDGRAIEWTKPDEFVPEEKDPMKGLAGPFPGGFLAAFCDGHVQFIKLKIDPVNVWRVFDRDDGQPFNIDD